MDDAEIRVIGAAAGRAPSVRDAHPWRLDVSGSRIDVRGDVARWSEQPDPQQRQRHISCGAAAELAWLAVRSLGYACLVRTGPLGDGSDVLVRLSVGSRQPPTRHELELMSAVPRIGTAPRHHRGESIPSAVLARSQQAATDRGCWLRQVAPYAERRALREVLGHARAREDEDLDHRAERVPWRATTHLVPEARSAPSGSTVGDVLSQAESRAGHGDFSARWPVMTAPVLEQDALVVLGTDTDTPHDWLRAGRALASLQVTLAAEGFGSRALGPVSDMAATRRALRRQFGEVGFAQLVMDIER